MGKKSELANSEDGTIYVHVSCSRCEPFGFCNQADRIRRICASFNLRHAFYDIVRRRIEIIPETDIIRDVVETCTQDTSTRYPGTYSIPNHCLPRNDGTFATRYRLSGSMCGLEAVLTDKNICRMGVVNILKMMVVPNTQRLV